MNFLKIENIRVIKYERYTEVKAVIDGIEKLWQFCGNYNSPRANNFKRYLEMENLKEEDIFKYEKSLGAKRIC